MGNRAAILSESKIAALETKIANKGKMSFRELKDVVEESNQAFLLLDHKPFDMTTKATNDILLRTTYELSQEMAHRFPKEYRDWICEVAPRSLYRVDQLLKGKG